MKTQEVVASFMADCKLRGLAKKTLETYDYQTKQLISISYNYPPKPESIQQFLANLKGGSYNADSHWRTYHALGNYAEKRWNIPNPMRSVTRPKVRREIMPTITATDLNLLSVYLNKASLRDRAIVTLFIDTAIRKGEAAGLQGKDILEDRIIIHGKTGYRVAPLSEVTRELLLSLPEHSDGYIFHGSNRGKKSTPLKSTGFYKVVGKYLKLIDYSGTKQYGPQVLRRSFGRFWLLDGGDMQSLSIILGHKNEQTTATYYAPLLARDVIEIHHKHTPVRMLETQKV